MSKMFLSWDHVVRIDKNVFSGECKKELDQYLRRKPVCDDFITLPKNISSPPFLYTKKLEGKGWSVFTSKDIQKGEIVTEYIGTIRRKSEDPKFKHPYNMGLIGDFDIDASYNANIARNINHMCSGNLNVRMYGVRNKPRLVFEAALEIRAGSELGYNYNFDWVDVKDDDFKACACKSIHCGGIIGAKKRKASKTQISVLYCIMCGKNFPHKKNLEAHMHIHTDEKPYNCTICDGVSFSQKSSLNTHRRAFHLGPEEKKAFQCVHKTCTKKFSRKWSMKKHFKRAHECSN